VKAYIEAGRNIKVNIIVGIPGNFGRFQKKTIGRRGV
jgi:hypothetical protein